MQGSRATEFLVQVAARDRGRVSRDGFGGADGDNGAAFASAAGSHVDDVVGGLDDVEVVLNDDNGVAFVYKALLMTSRLCSMTTTVLPLSTRR